MEVPLALSMRPQSSDSQSPVAPRFAAARSRFRSDSDPLRRSATSSAAMRRAMASPIGASPCVAAKVTAGTRPAAIGARAVDAGAESMPAATTTPAATPAAAPRRTGDQPIARPSPRPARRRSGGRAAHTIVSEPSTASFAANSVVQGAISNVARRPTDTA